MYYDRTLYNDILDEKYRLQYDVSTFWFSKDGSPQDGNPAIKWNPAYLSPGRAAAARRLRGSPGSRRSTSSTTTLDPPSSDQWSLGIRHNFGAFNASVAYTGVHGQEPADLDLRRKKVDDPLVRLGPVRSPATRVAILSRRRSRGSTRSRSSSRSRSLQLRWGGSLSYVYGDAEQTGQRPLQLRTRSTRSTGRRQRSNLAQKHQITLSAIGRPPAGPSDSPRSSDLGSGFPYGVTDCSEGWTTLHGADRRRRSAEVDPEHRLPSREAISLSAAPSASASSPRSSTSPTTPTSRTTTAGSAGASGRERQLRQARAARYNPRRFAVRRPLRLLRRRG